MDCYILTPAAATCRKSHLVEDVWYILLGGGLFSEAQLRSVFAGQ